MPPVAHYQSKWLFGRSPILLWHAHHEGGHVTTRHAPNTPVCTRDLSILDRSLAGSKMVPRWSLLVNETLSLIINR